MINLKYQLDQKGGSDLADLIKLCNGVERINIIPSINPNNFNQTKANKSVINTKNIKFENALFFLFPRCYDNLLRFFYKCVKITDGRYPNWLDEIVVNEKCGKMVVQLQLFKDLDQIVIEEIEDSCSGTNCHEKVKQILYAQAIIKGGTYTKPIVKYFFNQLLIRLLLFLKLLVENDIIMDYNVDNKGKENSKILSKDIRLPNSKYFTDVPTSLEDYNSSQAVVIFLTELVDKFLELSSGTYAIYRKEIKEIEKNNQQLFNKMTDIEKKDVDDWVYPQDFDTMDEGRELLKQVKRKNIRLGFSYINSAILGYKEMVYFGY